MSKANGTAKATGRTRNGAPRPREATARRREEILKAALATFGSKGFYNGPLTEIAEQADMTHAGILHHFGSKNQLLLEVLDYRDRSDVALLEGQHIPDGVDLFRHLVRTAALNATRAGIVQAYAVLSAESVTEGHPGRAYFVGRYEQLRGEVARAFEEWCHELGVTDPGPIANGSAAVLAAMDGLQIQWLLDPDAVDLAEATAFAIDAVASAVVAPTTSPLGPRSDWPPSPLGD